MKLSVVIATFNGKKYIEEQISSILNQTRPVDEIIVCDDGSTDDTLAIADDILSNSSIKYQIIKNTENLGVANNFLNGMKRTSGDYVFCCDQDDVWKNNKVKAFLNHIEKSGKLLYFSNGLIVDESLKSLNYTLWDIQNFHYDQNKNNIYNILLNRTIVTGASMAASKELVQMIDKIPSCWLHDAWFAFAAARLQSIEAINEVTFFYRQHGSNEVGASSNRIKDRISKYIRNLRRIESIRGQRLIRFSEVSKLQSNLDEDLLFDCIDFWQDMNRIDKRAKIKSAKIINKNLKNNRYSLYYTGEKGAVRDLISIL